MRGKGSSTIVTIAIAAFLVLAVLAPVCHSASEEEEITRFPLGWTDDINISNNETIDEYPNMAVSGASIHAVWRHTWFGDVSIMYRNSNDAGNTWNERQQIIPVSPMLPSFPDIGVSDTAVHVVYHMWETSSWEINYINSTDGGETWNPSKMISIDDSWNSQYSEIAINSSEIHVVWIDQRHRDESMPWNTELYYVRSLDGGITWDDGLGNIGQERRLTNALYESYGGQYGLSVEGDAIHLVWGDARNGISSGEIYYKRSLYKGATWEDGLGNIDQDRLLTTNLTNSHGLPTIAVNGTTIHAAWVDTVWPGPNYYIYYRNSTDNGATWNPIQLLVSSGTAFNPSLNAVGSEVHVVWDDWRDTGTTKEIYYKNSTDGGISWGPETRLTVVDDNSSAGPKIAVSGNYKHVTWIDQRDGNLEIYYKRSPDFPPDPTFNISLDLGWNLISLPLEQRDESISEVLSSINGKWDYIQAYDALGPDHWKTNATFKPSQLNDLHTLNHKIGFWINITEPGVILTVSGVIPSSTTIPLYAGWNLVGYPSLANETVGNALWGTGADKVEVFDPGEPYRIREVGPSYVMKPGEGYWVHVPADTVWTIDW